MVTASLHPTPVSTLPLHALHVAHGARMEPFAGWTMPIHYAAGVLKEHLHTRSAAGLFDVSHMGQIMVRARSGDPKDAARALEALLPVDVVGLRPGRQRYALLTTDAGGIRDDLMIANLGDFWYLVVNAAVRRSRLLYLAVRLYRRGWLRDFRPSRASRSAGGSSASPRGSTTHWFGRTR
jgi:aminomethyltransferase